MWIATQIKSSEKYNHVSQYFWPEIKLNTVEQLILYSWWIYAVNSVSCVHFTNFVSVHTVSNLRGQKLYSEKDIYSGKVKWNGTLTLYHRWRVDLRQWRVSKN